MSVTEIGFVRRTGVDGGFVDGVGDFVGKDASGETGDDFGDLRVVELY